MMKLWEAISLGATLRPQTSGAYMSRDRQSTCAFGGALEACGVGFMADHEGDPMPLKIPFEIWPGITSLIAPDPLLLDEPHTVEGLIPRLNDFGWTREAIAEWLRPIEEAYLAGLRKPEQIAAVLSEVHA